MAAGLRRSSRAFRRSSFRTRWLGDTAWDGTAALEIVRRYLDDAGDTFEVTIRVHPAERFSMSMRLLRSDS